MCFIMATATVGAGVGTPLPAALMSYAVNWFVGEALGLVQHVYYCIFINVTLHMVLCLIFKYIK